MLDIPYRTIYRFNRFQEFYWHRQQKIKKMANHHSRTPHPEPLKGSTANKYAVVLDGGRTVIFISDKSKEAETRERYASRNR